jgi:hypothetical protein
MIGGEFEIDLSLQREFVPQPDVYYYASGRTALYQILRSLAPQYRKLWLPDWLCHTMVDAVEKAGFEYRFYVMDADFKATIDALDKSGFKDGEAVLMINYFGLQDLAVISQTIKDAYPQAVVIEDDVQAYWAFAEKENPFADYCFTSLRKALPVPDGGLVKTKRPMPRAIEKNTFAPLKIKAGAMKFHRGEEGINDEDYLKLFKEGDKLIPENYDSVMNLDSQRLFAGTDLEKAKKQRQANAAQLIAGLEKLGIKPMIQVSVDSVPLFVPIYLENRDEVRRRMFQHEVFCPIHWPLDGMPVKRGADMAAHELSLIMDQRYGEKDMDLMISLIK